MDQLGSTPELQAKVAEVLNEAEGYIGVEDDSPACTTLLLCQCFLSDIDWERMGYGEISTPNRPLAEGYRGLTTIALALTTARFNRANMALYRLWERMRYIQTYDQYEDYCQEISAATSASHARSQFIEDMATEHQRANPGQLNRDKFKQAVHNVLLRGSRWRRLVNAMQSKEILLMDQDLHVMSPGQSIGTILNNGDDAEFADLKEFLLDPENNVKTKCSRLSGVADMIKDLSEAQPNSELWQYLCSTIRKRIRSELGDPGAGGDIPQSGLYRGDEIQETILNVLGIVGDIHLPNFPQEDDLEVIGRDAGVYYEGGAALPM